MPLAVFDNTVLSNFALVRRPDLLRLAFPESIVVSTVRQELQEGERSGAVPVCDWSWLPVVDLGMDEGSSVEHLEKSLDPGELDSIAAASSRQALFLSDDRPARRAAEALGLTVSGTLGVLLKLVQAKRLTEGEADRLLAEMMSRGYRSPVRSMIELL